MTSDVQGVQARLDEAEREARALLAVCPGHWEGRWARDRLRLIARDRATLERHQATPNEWGPRFSDICASKGCGMWPCPDARAVVGYWLDEETR